MEQDVEKLQELVDQYDRIVFFMVQESLPRVGFRISKCDGLYNQKYDYPPEITLGYTFFCAPRMSLPVLPDKMLALDAKPNDAHKKLAEMEEAGKLTVVTQNIDGLHCAAGSNM